MALHGEDVKEVFERILPDKEIVRMAHDLGVVERERVLEIVALVRAMVIAVGTPSGGIQADILRSYLHFEVKKIGRSGFYRWFDPELESLMEKLASRALEYAKSTDVDLPKQLTICRDWIILDSTTIHVRDALKDEYPGTGDYAAIKVHKFYSVGRNVTIDYHFGPAKEHDSKHLMIDESWAGLGLLVDKAYVGFGLLWKCKNHDVHYVVRLKENWKARVNRINRGEVAGTFVPGADFDLLIDNEVLTLEGDVLDLDVTVGRGSNAIEVRLIGLRTPKGWCFFLTNLPKDIEASLVGDIYRIRWEVELSMKLDKSVNRLDESDAERPCSIKTLLHASLISSIITCILVHKHNMRVERSKMGRRSVPPLHQMLVAKMLATMAWDIARTLEMKGEEARASWDRIAGLIVHAGKDPNWRRRPSVLDRLRGWEVSSTKRCSSKSKQLQA